LYNPSALSLWSSFISVLRIAIDLYVPRFKCITKDPNTKRKLYPKHLRKLRAQKCRIWRQLKCNTTDVLIRTHYLECVHEWRIQTHESEKQAELRVIKSSNLGTFYKYVNKRISYRSGIGALIDNAGHAIVNIDVKYVFYVFYFLFKKRVF